MTTAMRKTTVKAAALFTALSLLAAPAAFSDEHQQGYEHQHKKAHSGHRMKQGQHGVKMLRKMARYLDLSDEQVAQIKEIRRQSKTENEPLRTAMKAFKTEVKNQQSGSEFDETAFSATYLQYQETFAQLALQKAKTRHAIFQVLTPEQQTKWQAFQEKRKARRGLERS
ncbi:Spy/CpxP family protein refolding chaperone [Thalassotalea euphylliae]|uniref:Periplasmic heavy metal sensor n=1 Tax=Thalassotalea euphylliae TaxID=1655234 RepID=A0A3E0U456_9GAMM|nr:Spy/CpxP family protein refolding chaperone [Thalassotalea euphylliae]REL31494.1 hypothetical protein DXX94_12640 [Thalassotalea euphylliae]